MAPDPDVRGALKGPYESRIFTSGCKKTHGYTFGISETLSLI